MHFSRLGILAAIIAVSAPVVALAQMPAAPASLPLQNLPCKAEMDALNAKYPPSANPDMSALNAMRDSAESKALQDCLQNNMPSLGAVGSTSTAPARPTNVPQPYTGSVSPQSQLCIRLPSNLSFGSRGADVVQLQQYLISQNLLAADSATGSDGLTPSVISAGSQKPQCSSGNLRMALTPLVSSVPGHVPR